MWFCHAWRGGGGGGLAMDQARRLVVNTISNVAALAVRLVIGFVLAPFVLHHLGQSTYGIWALTGSLFAYSSLLSLGLNSAVNRWVPLYLVEKNHEGINRVVNTTLVAYLIAAGADPAKIIAGYRRCRSTPLSDPPVPEKWNGRAANQIADVLAGQPEGRAADT